MGRRTRLSEYERGETDGRVAAGEDHKTIATATGHDKRTVDKVDGLRNALMHY